MLLTSIIETNFKLLIQGYRYHNILKLFQFYHGLKILLQQGISELVFYVDSVYKFKRIVGKPNFSDQFKKIIKRYKKWDTTWISRDSLHALL